MVIIHAPPIHALYVIIRVVTTQETMEFNAIVGLAPMMHVVRSNFMRYILSLRKSSTIFCW